MLPCFFSPLPSAPYPAIRISAPGPAKAAEATVSVPRELLATVKSGYVKLNWTKTSGADHYFIYRKASSGSYKKLATVKGAVTSWIDRTAPGGGKFTYAVSAVKTEK